MVVLPGTQKRELGGPGKKLIDFLSEYRSNYNNFYDLAYSRKRLKNLSDTNCRIWSLCCTILTRFNMEAGLIPGLLNDYCNEYYLEYDEKVYTIRAINLIYPVMVAVEEEKAKMKKKG